VGRVGPHEGGAAADPFAPRPAAYPQFAFKGHYELHAMVPMLRCRISRPPDDHGGRPK